VGVVLALAVAGPGYSQINTGGFTPIQRATFNMAQAYPATSGSYPVAGQVCPSPVAIAPNGCWNPSIPGFSETNPIVVPPTLGTRCNTTLQPQLFNAIPAFGQTGFAVAGVLCLPTGGDLLNPRLNVNSFIVPPAGVPANQCFVQMVRLVKEIPGSIKCPDVYGTPVFDPITGARTGQPAKTYVQFGATPSGIRTWWALSYTMPGTKFHLELTVVCPVPNSRARDIHVDRWTWQVVSNSDTLPVVINLLHTSTVGTMEIPCVVSEQAYCDLMAAAGLIKLADASNDLAQRSTAIQVFEGLIDQYCTFVDFVDPTILFPGPIDPSTGLATYQPPGDLGDIPGGLGAVGIIDSLEHPCCCKLLVDVERIGQDWGVSF
jgi:hypothetical protein